MARYFTWWPLARYSHWDAVRNGRKDGSLGIPDENQEKQPAYILQLKQLCEENIERTSLKWKRRDAVLLAEFCKAKTTIENLKEDLGHAEAEALKAREDGRTAQEEYSKHFHVSPFWYRMMIGAIAILEVPLNSVVFQLFGEQQAFTLLTSIGLGIVLPLCAHFIGGLLRHGFLRAGKLAVETWLIIILVFVAIGSLGGIAYLREKFFEGSGVQKLLGLNMDYTTVTLIFFVINLLIFAVATVAAYVSHDPVASQFHIELKTARKLRRNAEKKVKLLEQRLQQAQAREHEIRSLRQKSFEETRHEIDELRNIVQRLISVYEQANQQHRGSTKKPVSFEHYPEINTRDPRLDPRKDGTLDWDCQNFVSLKLATADAEEREA